MNTTLVAQYFLNHRLDPAEVEAQTRQLAQAGFGGVEAHARQGLMTPYMSEAWWRAVDRIMAACRATGMRFWIWDEDYFPSGLAGGRVVWSEPGLAAQQLSFSVNRVSGAGPHEIDFPEGSLLRAFALPVSADETFGPALDITAHCGTRRQRWTERAVRHHAYSPRISRLGHPHWRSTCCENRFAVCWTAPTEGIYVIVAILQSATALPRPDHLRPEAIAKFIELSYEVYRQRYGDDFGKLIEAAFTDEPSPGCRLYPWTADFAKEFERDHGYDLMAALPHLAVDINADSTTVRHHFRLTQHRLQTAAYTEQIGDWCRRYGLAWSGHLTRTEWLSLTAAWWPNELRCYRAMDVPAVDPLGAACGPPEAAAYHSGVKVASSAAHLFGRLQAGSDALAVVGDEARLRDLKYLLDYQMVLGINQFNIHGLCYSLEGPRKDEAPPSLFYQHTEWPHMRHLWDYVNRTCRALTDGRHQCRLALLYPSTSLACQLLPGDGGFDLPDEQRIHDLVELLLSHQCDFDWIDEATWQENVDDAGRLHTPEAYPTIVLPHLRYIDERTAEALRRFSDGGGRVVAVGRMPLALPRTWGQAPHEWAGAAVEMVETPRDDQLAQWAVAKVEGPRRHDVFVLKREKDGRQVAFLFNRHNQPFSGSFDGQALTIPPRGGLLWTDGEAAADSQPETAASASVIDLSSDWQVEFADNHVPLNMWQLGAENGTISGLAAFDLLRRERPPQNLSGPPYIFYCRFMLTGDIPDAYLVIEPAAFTGSWRLFVNDTGIEAWEPAHVYDCRNLRAPVAAALRSGGAPTLNVIRVVVDAPDGGPHEPPYLYGSFAAHYRFGECSLPFLHGPDKQHTVGNLQPWSVWGRPTFSGTAIYRRRFHVPEVGTYELDLGQVEDVAVVHLDQREGITAAWPPYRCRWADISAGEHELTIELTNCPANRDRAAGFTAGLLGPVRLIRIGEHRA